MITYEAIKQANESIKSTPISRKDKHGNVVTKDYAEVNQRIKAFRMCYPYGTIETQMLSNENGICVFRARVGVMSDGVFTVLGTGTAYEREDSSFINKTSYIENCETSAVGRALGMCGFGIDISIASYEEVSNAIENQKPEEKKATPKQLEILGDFYTGELLTKLLHKNSIDKLEDISRTKASELIGKLREKKGNENE